MNANRFVLALCLCVAWQTSAWADPQDQPSDAPVTGVDVFNVVTQGGDPGGGSDTFNIPVPTMYGGGVPGANPSSPGPKNRILNLGGKSGCQTVTLTDRQYFEITAHLSPFYCAANGTTPGIHQMCNDLPADIVRKCWNPPPPQTARLINQCTYPGSPCWRLLRQEYCADVYRLDSELQSGAPLPPQSPMAIPVKGQNMLVTLRGNTELQCRMWGFPPPLRGYVSTGGPPEDGGLPLPPDVRNSLLQLAAKLDQTVRDTRQHALAANDRFFKCAAEAIESDLRFLAQPGYVPAAQMAQSLHEGVWNYITNNAYDNNRQLYLGAVSAMNHVMNDPACAFGQVVPDIAAMAITHKVNAMGEAALAQKAGNTALTIAEGSAEFEGFAERNGMYGSPPASNPPWSNPSNYFNPQCAPNMCFPSAIAQDVYWETGERLSARTFAGNVSTLTINGQATQVSNLTAQKTAETLLSSLYGGRPLQGPALAAQRMIDQLWGRPSVLGRLDIASELANAGRGSKGLVFVEYSPTKLNPDPPGHAFNARNVNGTIQFVDPSNGNIDATHFFTNAQQVKFYRTR